MKEGWSLAWKKVLVWISGYISFVAFAIVGGYVVAKSDNQKLKKTTLIAFIVSLIFTALSAFLSIYYNCMLLDGNASKGAQDFYIWFGAMVLIVKTITYLVFIILSFILDRKES